MPTPDRVGHDLTLSSRPPLSSTSRKANQVTEIRDTPAPPPFVAGLLPPSPDLETAWHEQAEWEIEVAYHEGYQAALMDIAYRHAELDAAWKSIGQRLYADRVRDRINEMAAIAKAQHAQHSTREWVGLDNGATLPSADWTWDNAGGAA